MVGWKPTKTWRSVPDIRGVIVLEKDAQLLRDAFYDYTVTRLRKIRERHRLSMADKWRLLTSRVRIYRALKQKYILDDKK